MNNNLKTKYLMVGAIIAALYVVLTIFINAFGLANGAIQVRVSEALTILPCFTSAAIPGLTIGCLLANLLTGCALPDIVFGTLATFLGAVGTYYFRKNPVLAAFMPILSNTVIIPFVLIFAYGFSDTYTIFGITISPYIFSVITIFIGEFISCGVLGLILHKVLKSNSKIQEYLN